MTAAGRRHLVLVGLPGAGKTVAGRGAAALLATRFTDLDQRIEARAGQAIPEIFAARGEAAFRSMEQEEMAALLATPPHVIAAGGGWAAQPGNLESAGDQAVVMWLEVSPGEAARRLEKCEGGDNDHGRPLLAGDLPARLQELLEQRRPFYQRAPFRVATDGRDPAAVSEEVAALAQAHGGW